MISTDMRIYNYYTYGEDNGYGQPSLSATPTGTIKMAINITTQSTQDNINYADAEYISAITVMRIARRHLQPLTTQLSIAQ